MLINDEIFDIFVILIIWNYTDFWYSYGVFTCKISYRYESRTGTKSCRSNTATGMKPIQLPVSCKQKQGHNRFLLWLNSYRYESRTGMKVVLVWKSYRYESRTGMKVVPVWKFYRYECRTGMKIVPVWNSYRYESFTCVKVVPVWKS